MTRMATTWKSMFRGYELRYGTLRVYWMLYSCLKSDQKKCLFDSWGQLRSFVVNENIAISRYLANQVIKKFHESSKIYVLKYRLNRKWIEVSRPEIIYNIFSRRLVKWTWQMNLINRVKVRYISLIVLTDTRAFLIRIEKEIISSRIIPFASTSKK